MIPVMIRDSDSYMRIAAEAGVLMGVYLQARVSVLYQLYGGNTIKETENKRAKKSKGRDVAFQFMR